MTQKEYWYWLCTMKTINARKIHTLLAYFQTPEAVFQASAEEIGTVIPMKEREKMVWQESRNNLSEKTEDYHKLQSMGIQFITMTEPEYPKRLKNIYDPPGGIFVKGKLPDDDRPGAAIIGARACSNYGREMAGYLGEALAEQGIQIISGMAMGIDGWGHRGALKAGGDTYGVLGCGPDICYPRENMDLYLQIPLQGGLLSEYPPGTPALGMHFPVRNRIIAALSDCVLVVEARSRSGTFITVDQALEQGKEVMALPGRLDDPLSLGCNQLIRNGAGIITGIEDILEYFHISCKNSIQNTKSIKKVLAKEEKIIYSCLRLQPKHVEEILKETAMPVSQVRTILLQLELKGYISQPQKSYYAIRKGSNHVR